MWRFQLRLSVVFFSLGLSLSQVAQCSSGDDSIFMLQSKWRAQDGMAHPLSDMRGTPVVLSMIYTGCQATCPLTLRDLKRIESALPLALRTKVRFALFSFDSDQDLPVVLKRFAKAHDLDLSRWTLFQGDAAAVRELAAVLGLQYKKNSRGEYDHSSLIAVIDAKGRIRYQRTGVGQDAAEITQKITFLLNER